MKKKILRLTESDLHKIVKESVNRVLINEIGDTERGQRMLGRVGGRAYDRGDYDYADEVADYAEKNSHYGDSDFMYGIMEQQAYEEMMRDKDFLYKIASVYDAYKEGADDQQLLDAFGYAFELGDYRYRE